MHIIAPILSSSATQKGLLVDAVDVVVVGAGAGGLATAVTAAHQGLSVLVLERAEVCGGATAWSGGWMWAPGNPLAHADGVVEDVEEFRTYLRAAL
ncbi:MAG: FAD-dependent oxidoreductase, partial [Pseudonocardia sp.]|nr:FAD-dependent oxidoreductase [Pseudonocardia sp.]